MATNKAAVITPITNSTGQVTGLAGPGGAPISISGGNPINYTPQDIDIQNVWPAEPLISLLNLPSPYAPGLSREHAYLVPVYFNTAWNGYHYWGAAAPYPGSSNIYENPCVYCSNDGENWVAAPGVTNPVFGKPAAGNNADPSFTISPDGSTLYLSWVWENAGTAIPGGYGWAVMCSSSTDGKTWSAPTVLYGTTSAGGSPDSPTLVWNPTSATWSLFTFIGGGASVGVQTTSGTNPMTGTWSGITTVSVVNPLGRTWWHGHFIAVTSGFGTRIIGLMQDNNASGGTVYAVSSDDGGLTFGVTPFSAFDSAVALNSWYKPSFCLIPDVLNPQLVLFASRNTCYSTTANSISWTIQKCRLTLTAANRQFQSANIRDMVNRQVLPGKGVIIYDSFNRTASTTSLGTADSGQAWASDSGAAYMGLTGTQAYNVTTTLSRAQIDPKVQDFYAEVTVSTAGTACYLAFNYQDSSNYWRFGTGTGYGLVLQKVVAGAVTFIGSSGGATLHSGDIMAVERRGSYISVYVNDRIIDSISDSTFAKSTVLGLVAGGAVTSNFDNFIVRRGWN